MSTCEDCGHEDGKHTITCSRAPLLRGPSAEHMAAESDPSWCGVCRNECKHGQAGGTEFCVFCLRRHGDHLGTEIHAANNRAANESARRQLVEMKLAEAEQKIRDLEARPALVRDAEEGDDVLRCECCGYDAIAFGFRHGQMLCEDCVYTHDEGSFACGCYLDGRAEPRAVACPTCKAAPDAPCEGSDESHEARQLAANEAVRAVPDGTDVDEIPLMKPERAA